MEYVRILIGDVPDRFIDRRRDFYRCLAFSALLVSQNRTYTGYKELNTVKVDPEDLIGLDIVRPPTEKGAFSLNIKNSVTYSPMRNPLVYYLDCSAFGNTNVTDVLVKRDPEGLYDYEAGMYYNPSLLEELSPEWKKGFLRKLGANLNCPANELLQKCVVKQKIVASMRPDESLPKITHPKSKCSEIRF